jgi:hypothetical protein
MTNQLIETRPVDWAKRVGITFDWRAGGLHASPNPESVYWTCTARFEGEAIATKSVYVGNDWQATEQDVCRELAERLMAEFESASTTRHHR